MNALPVISSLPTERPFALTGPQTELADGLRIDQVIAEHARRQPDAPALIWCGQVVSYGELLSRAETMAQRLVEHGVEPGDVVSVWLPRRPELVVTLLAILLSGATYSGLPADWPAARVADCVGRCSARVLVTDQPAAEVWAVPTVPPPAEDESVATPVHDGAAALHPTNTWPTPAGAAEAACIFFTSGSTGEPKGVAVPHRGLLRLVHDERLELGTLSRSLVGSPVVWDAFVLEAWLPLLVGGSCLINPGGPLTARDLRGFVEGGLNWIFLTSAVFAALVQDDLDSFAGIRTVLIGGERASAPQVVRFREAYPEVTLLNLYGPVEGSVFLTAHRVDAAAVDIPIGTPAPNTTVYVLDADHRPVLPGTPGEIAAAGDGTALGYLGNELETARRFPRLPLGPGGALRRVYLTGDIGMVGDDGTLRYLGRTDRQVKVRGNRVELDEVERALAGVPGVVRGVVVPRKTELTTVLVGCYSGSVEPAEVRAAVAAVLPPSYVPDLFTRYETLPLTDNGKVDTAALAEVTAAEAEDGIAETLTEAAEEPEVDPLLAHCRQVVTEIVEFPLEDTEDMFNGGANSLSVVRIANRLGVSAVAVYRARTIAKITALLARRAAEPTPPPASPPEPPPAPAVAETPAAPLRARPADMSRIQANWAWLEMAAPGAEDFLCSSVFDLSGSLDISRLRSALRAVVTRHPVLRTIYPTDADGRLTAVELPVEDVLQVAPAAADAVAAAEIGFQVCRRRFRLAQEVPIRAVLVPYGPAGAVLALQVHHVAFDGWSLDVLLSELSQPLGGRIEFSVVSAAQPVPDDTEARRQWRTQLDTMTAPPIGRAFGVPRHGPAGAVEVPLERALLDTAAARASERDRTVFSELLASYVRAVTQVYGVDELAVAVPTVNRTTSEAEQAIGPFANTFVLGFRDLSSNAVSEAAHRQVGWMLERPMVDVDGLLAELVPAEQVWNTYYQVGFSMHEWQLDKLALPGVTASVLPVPRRNSLTKLVLNVWTGGQPYAELVYRRDAVSRSDAEQIAARWRADLDSSTRPAVLQRARRG